jgi:hypothetical protein
MKENKEDSMKRTLKKIAFVLLVLMFACAVTGCELLLAAVDFGSEVAGGINEIKTEKSLYRKAMQNDEADTF